MKSIKLTANAFKGKDYIVSVPVVVKPAVTTNLSYNLKEAMNTNPNLGLVLSDAKYSSLNNNASTQQLLNKLLTHKDANNNNAPLVTVEDIFDPAEYLKLLGHYQKQDLTDPDKLPEGLFLNSDESESLEDVADLLAIDADTIDETDPQNPVSVPSVYIAHQVIVQAYNSDSDAHQLRVPVKCEILTPIPAGVVLSDITDKDGNIIGSYSINIDGSVVPSGTTFSVKVTLDMSEAKVFEDANDTTGTALTNPEIIKWKASRVFKAAVA